MHILQIYCIFIYTVYLVSPVILKLYTAATHLILSVGSWPDAVPPQSITASRLRLLLDYTGPLVFSVSLPNSVFPEFLVDVTWKDFINFITKMLYSCPFLVYVSQKRVWSCLHFSCRQSIGFREGLMTATSELLPNVWVCISQGVSKCRSNNSW